jgi:hypothetical protein
MTTNWATPSTIIQAAEEGAESVHISWDTQSISTTEPLYHIARAPKHDLKSKTYFLTFSGFNFIGLPDTLTGIELRLTAKRRGRVMDETIQLCLDNNLVGDNKASRSLDVTKLYGGENDLWNTENLSITDITSPTFGVKLRFQSHPDWPHRDPILISAVELRIY